MLNGDDDGADDDDNDGDNNDAVDVCVGCGLQRKTNDIRDEEHHSNKHYDKSVVCRLHSKSFH